MDYPGQHRLQPVVTHPLSCRAEATDVANAVLDGVDGMLMGAETLRGKYPVETVRTVLAICRQAELTFDHESHFDRLMARAMEVGYWDSATENLIFKISLPLTRKQPTVGRETQMDRQDSAHQKNICSLQPNMTRAEFIKSLPGVRRTLEVSLLRRRERRLDALNVALLHVQDDEADMMLDSSHHHGDFLSPPGGHSPDARAVANARATAETLAHAADAVSRETPENPENPVVNGVQQGNAPKHMPAYPATFREHSRTCIATAAPSSFNRSGEVADCKLMLMAQSEPTCGLVGFCLVSSAC